MMVALVGWYNNASTDTPAFRDHQRMIDEFLEKKHHFHQHAWKLLGEREALRTHADIIFVIEDITYQREVNASDLFSLLSEAVAQARKRGARQTR